MNPDLKERLYQLLPAIYRVRDHAYGEPLRSLLAVLETELDTLETDIDTLYDNWFIETCSDWLVPYIADLLDVRELYAENTHTYGQEERRAFVANTLAYRRRKGTTPVLEELVRDVTGWRARAVECFNRLATSQNLNSSRPSATVSLRRSQSPELLGNTPFEKKVSYTPDIRSIASGKGIYNLPNIALFIWRLQSYPINQVSARAVHPCDQPQQKGLYTFSPLGIDAPLFNIPQTETNITKLAEEINVPGLLRAESLSSELQQRREDSAQSPDRAGYFGDHPVFNVSANGVPINPLNIWIRSLRDLPTTEQLSPNECSFVDGDSSFQVAVDPELGRLAFPPKALPDQVTVDYAYGFSGDVGGGPYRRIETENAMPIGVSKRLYWDIVQCTNTQPLADALQAWNLTAQRWQSCYDKHFIPLARVRVSLATSAEASTAQLLDPQAESAGQPAQRINARIQPTFQPGLIEGLTIQAQIGADCFAVLPGRAIDAKGRSLALARRQLLGLKAHCNQTLAVCLSYRLQRVSPIFGRRKKGDVRLQLVPVARRSPDSLVLAELQTNSRGQISNINLATRQTFSPGLILARSDDELTAVSLNQRAIVVAPVWAINVQGVCFASPRTEIAIAGNSQTDRTLVNTLTQTFGLTQALNASITITLYLKPPSKGPSTTAAAGQAQIEIVPEGTGIITIRDNSTYAGDWTVQVPSARSLHLSAASGYRPHVWGNGTIYALSSDREPGDIRLAGLLIEGQLTAIGRHLKCLSLQHCTLVPQKGGLLLSPAADPDTPPSAVSEPTPSATDCRQQIRSLLTLPIESPSPFDPNALQATVSQLSQLVVHEIKQLIAIAQQGIKYGYGKADDLDLCDLLSSCRVVESEASLAQIETVDIQRSICGPLWLGEGINQLQITDSLIETGRADAPIGAVAIAAPYSALTLNTTTVLGTTTARTLESSNSLFNEGVVTLQRQTGCLRFCYVPESSQTPSRYRCQPDQALGETLDTLPGSISALSGNSTTGHILVGTVGQGLFQQTTAADNSTALAWKKVSTFDHHTITALLTYAVPSSPADPAADQILAFAATAEGKLYCAKPDSNAELQWTPLPAQKSVSQSVDSPNLFLDGADSEMSTQQHLPETYITTLNVYQRQCSGQVQISSAADFESSDDETSDPSTQTPSLEVTILQGTGTAFLSELKLGDIVQFGPYLNRVIQIDSDEQLKIGLIADTSSDTRTDTDGTDTDESPLYTMTVHNLFAGSAGTGLFRFTPDGHSCIAINYGLTHRWISAVATNPKGHLFVGTLGGGIFRSLDNGSHWQSINCGLDNLSISALHCDDDGALIAGTSGSGLFTFDSEGDRWHPLNGADADNKLPNLNITAVNRYRIPAVPSEDALPEDSSVRESEPETASVEPAAPRSMIIVGTDGGGLFRSLDEGNSWIPISPSFANLNITTLLALTNKGTTSDETTSGETAPENTISFLAGTAAGSLIYASDTISLVPPPSAESLENTALLWQSANTGLPGVDEKLLILRRLQPSFVSLSYGAPGYGQLSDQCPSEILTGAEDGSEIGLFSYLKQPQKAANLRASLNEYLRFGLEAGIFYRT